MSHCLLMRMGRGLGVGCKSENLPVVAKHCHVLAIWNRMRPGSAWAAGFLAVRAYGRAVSGEFNRRFLRGSGGFLLRHSVPACGTGSADETVSCSISIRARTGQRHGSIVTTVARICRSATIGRREWRVNKSFICSGRKVKDECKDVVYGGGYPGMCRHCAGDSDRSRLR